MSTTSHRPSIYEMVLSGSGSNTAEKIRYLIADEASSDANWRMLYDEVIDQGLPMPETIAPTGVTHTPGRAFAALGAGPTQRAALLWARIVELGEDVRLPDEEDLVAAVCAAEIWLATTGGSNLNCAASFGCDTINSLAAILARSVGDGVDPNPVLAHPTQGPADVTIVTRAVNSVRPWAEEMLGANAWPMIRTRIAADLGWCAVGGSVTAHAASIVGGC